LPVRQIDLPRRLAVAHRSALVLRAAHEDRDNCREPESCLVSERRNI